MEILGLDMIKKEPDTINITGLDKIRQVFHNDLPRMSPFATELIRLVNRARELDTEYRQFGAEQHRYEFNPVIPLSKVRDFEKRHQIRLPQGYVDFLTQVGNGGAGPDYGIYSLEQAEFEGYYDHKNSFCHYTETKNQSDYYNLPYSIENKMPMVNSQLSDERWNKWYTELNRLEENEYNEKYKQAYNGLLQIINSGCCTGYMLVCHGDISGEVVFFRHELECPELVGQSFEEFVLSHFKGVISKFEKNN